MLEFEWNNQSWQYFLGVTLTKSGLAKFCRKCLLTHKHFEKELLSKFNVLALFYHFLSTFPCYNSSDTSNKFFAIQKTVCLHQLFSYTIMFIIYQRMSTYILTHFSLSVLSIQTKLPFTLVMMIHNTFVIVSKWLNTILFVLQFSLKSMFGWNFQLADYFSRANVNCENVKNSSVGH